MTIHLHENEDVRHVPYGVLDKSPDTMTEKERNAAALAMIAEYGGCESEEHLRWLLDYVARVLTGCPKEMSVVQIVNAGKLCTPEQLGESNAYKVFVARYNDGDEGPDTYEWDTGVAPNPYVWDSGIAADA